MDAKDYLLGHWMKNEIWTHLELPKHQARLRRCAETVRGGESFLDVGCGLGHSTAIMRGFVPGRWAGLEFFPGVLPEARAFFPDIKFYAAEDFNLLPVCGKWDGVVCSEVIEHVPDDAGLLRGLLEITNKTLVLSTPARYVNDPGHLRLYTHEMLDALLEGLDAKVLVCGRFFYITVRKDLS